MRRSAKGIRARGREAGLDRGYGVLVQTPTLDGSVERGMADEYAIWNGPLVPYVRTTQRQKYADPRYKKYHAWKEAFRLCLNTQMFPEVLDPKTRYSLDIEISAKGKVRWDLDNACKAIQDAAWKQDHQIKVLSARVLEDEGIDYVKVILRRAQ